MSENEVKPVKSPRGLFFYLRVLLVTCCLLFLAGGIAVYYVYHRLTTDSELEQMVMKKVGDAIGMEVKFARLNVSFPGIEISDVSIATDSESLKLAAQVAQLNIRPDLWAAFGGELFIDNLSVASATTMVELKKGPVGTASGEGSQSKAPFDPASIKLPFNSVDLTHLRFSVLDHNSGEKHDVLIDKAGISRSILSSSMPFNADVLVSGKAQLSVDGRLYWPSQVVADLKVKADNIEDLKKLIPAEYRQHAQPVKGAEVTTSLKYGFADGSLTVESCQVKLEPMLQADGKVQVDSFSPLALNAGFKIVPIAVNDVWPSVKGFVPKEYGLVVSDGKIGASVEAAVANGELKKITVTAAPENIVVTAAKLPEKLQLSRGQIRYEEGKITLAGFEARMADNHIKMPAGNVVIDPVAFAGDLSVEINLDSIWKLVSAYMPSDARKVTPGGAAAFSGKLAYNDKGIKIDGVLNSNRISLLETTTSAKASIEKIKIQFDAVTPTSGRVKIESLEVKGVGANVKVNGSLVNAKDPGFDLAASGNLSIDEFSRLGAGLFNVPVRPGQFRGDLSLDLKLGGTLANLKPKGSLEFKKLSADVSERGLTISNLNGSASADSDKLVIDKLSAELLGGKLAVSGSLSNFKKPVADARASVDGADLAAIRRLIKINFPDMPEEIEFSGRADLNVDIAGAVAEPVLKGDAKLHACRFNHPAVLRPIENIDGPISFNNSGLTTTGVKANWGTSKALVSGNLKDWAKFVTDFKFTVDPLDVTDAAGFFLKDTGYKVEGQGTGNGTVTGAVEKIKVAGVASVPVGVFSAPVSEKGDLFKFPFKNLQATAVYTENVLTVDPADLEMFSGKVKASGKVFIDKDPITFEFDTRIDQLVTEQFLAENTTYKDILRGGLDGTFAARGNTTGLVSLDGNASLAMQKGFYNSPPVVKKLSEQLGAPQLASGPIENVAGDYAISAGRISSKNTMVKTRDGRLNFVGSIGLDATLDGEAQLQLKKEVCQKSNVLRQLIGNAETLDVPVTVKGPFTSPSVGLPLDRMLKDAAERRLKESAQKEIGKLLGIKTGGQSAPVPAPETASATPATGELQPNVSAPSTPQASAPVQQSPQQKIEDKIKDVGKELKNLKNIFKKR